MVAKLKAFVMDVDGTLTDGKIYIGDKGESFKAFDVKDGYGIHEILPLHQVRPVIMTGRKSDIVANRAGELEIDIVLQGIKDKKSALKDLRRKMGWRWEEIAYIGDDVIDLPAMTECGFAACPKDAVKEVKEVCHYVCKRSAGHGAVREVINWLKEKNFEVET